MTVEVIKVESTQAAEEVVSQKEEVLNVVMENEKVEEEKKVSDEANTNTVEKTSSYREESNFLSDLKELDKKVLNELKLKLEEAILGNNLFKNDDSKSSNEGVEEKENPKEEEEGEKALLEAKDGEEEKKTISEEPQKEEGEKALEAKEDEQENKTINEEPQKEEEKNSESEEKTIEVAKDREFEEEKKIDVVVDEVDRDISLWGIPLLPSKGAEGTDVILLKFLRARDFKVNEAYEMLKKTLQWRKENKIDSILDEDLGTDLTSAAYMSGVDREGHPICYNIFGVLDNEEHYQKTFGTEEKREKFLRWRFQLMEKGIQKLDFKPAGVNSLLQINDLKNSPGPSKKEFRVSIKQAVGILQDNYPEFVARNIFINVPFWYYAFHALLSPFLTQRTKSKFVVARPAKVTETLLKYIPMEEIPVRYGGLKRDNDFEFSSEDGKASELVIRAGSTAIIDIPALEVGTTFIWDVAVLGWEVNYKEEFVPSDEGSYTIIIQKGKKLGTSEGPVRNTFRTNEPGKIVLVIHNGSSKKKKVFYRYKIKKSSF